MGSWGCQRLSGAFHTHLCPWVPDRAARLSPSPPLDVDLGSGVCVNMPVVTAVAVGGMSQQLSKEPAATVTVRRQPHTHGTRSAVPRCGRAGLAGCPQLGTEKVLVLGHGSRAWLGAGTPGMETLPHLESFAAKRAGLQQALPTICRCTGENNAGVCQTNSLELPPVPGACVLKRKPELRLQRNLGK